MASLRSMAGSEENLVKQLDQLEKSVATAKGQKVWREEGACEFVFELLRDDARSETLYEACWKVITAACRLTDEERETGATDNADYNVEHGAITALSRELARNPLLPEVLNHALACLTGICLLPHHVKAVMDANVVTPLLRLAENNCPDLVAVYSLICLTNLAINPSTHSALNEAGTVEVVQSLLPLLDSEEDEELDCGLSAAFIICRLSAGDENSPSAHLVRGNPKIIEMLSWILNEITMTSGPVLGSFWNPANVVLDVSILSGSEQTRPLMKPFVTLIANVLDRKSKGNRRLVELSLKTLENLALDDSCRAQMISMKDLLRAAIEKGLRLTGGPSSNGTAAIAAIQAILQATVPQTSPKPNIDAHIPPGHTSFTWSSPGFSVGLGHTAFSWGNV